MFHFKETLEQPTYWQMVKVGFGGFSEPVLAADFRNWQLTEKIYGEILPQYNEDALLLEKFKAWWVIFKNFFLVFFNMWFIYWFFAVIIGIMTGLIEMNKPVVVFFTVLGIISILLFSNIYFVDHNNADVDIDETKFFDYKTKYFPLRGTVHFFVKSRQHFSGDDLESFIRDEIPSFDDKEEDQEVVNQTNVQNSTAEP